MKKLHISPNLKLPLEAVTQTFAILAVRGAGKSNTAVVMAEEMHDAGLPFVVIDPVGGWWGLRSSADGKSAGLPIPIFGGRHGDVPIDRATGELVADLIVDKRLSCVIDISEFESEQARKDFLLNFAQRLYRKNKEPLHLFLEEADDYIPQKPQRDEARLLRAWENIIRRGRSRGIGITLITQRSAVLNKNALTQIETLFAMRTTGPQDRKAIEAWVKYQDLKEDLLASLPGLETGEAWCWSPWWLKDTKRVRIRRRRTFDSAATPKHRGQRRAATLADVDLPALEREWATTVERIEADKPAVLRRRITELERGTKELERKLKNKLVAPAPVIEYVEVPVLKKPDIKRLETVAGRLEDTARGIRSAITNAPRAPAKRAPVVAPPRAKPKVMPERGPTRLANGGNDTPMGAGERKILTAIAQHSDGVTRKQVTVLTGYKRSTRDRYIQLLRGKDLITDNGERIIVTQQGIAALGRDYEPLPTGAALLDYWRHNLPSGELACLEVAVASYPEPVDRETISDQTGYKRSTRDRYLQSLKLRHFITEPSRGLICANNELF